MEEGREAPLKLHCLWASEAGGGERLTPKTTLVWASELARNLPLNWNRCYQLCYDTRTV